MIVKQLIQIQEKLKLTDSQFAKSLGIHRVSWLRNKRTSIISSDILLRALEVYPEFKENFLSSFAINRKLLATGSITHNAPQTHQDNSGNIFRRSLDRFISYIKAKI